MREPSEVVIGGTTLDKIIENHNHWLNQDCENWESMRADLNNANLEGVDLRNVNLSHAYLKNASLINANLWGASLCDADLSNVNMQYANLVEANIFCAELSNANLRHADLSKANLTSSTLMNADCFNAKLIRTTLCKANLHGTNFECANLSNANLSYTDLYYTNFSSTALISADLNHSNMHCTIFTNAELFNADMEFSTIDDTVNFHNANLNRAKSVPYIPMACPSDGEFIGWKKASGYLVKLKIPASAMRSSAGSFKCRASKAKVLGIYTLDGKKTNIKSVMNDFGFLIEYVVGEYVYPDSFDDNRWNECSHGIHFFINKQDAIDY